MCVPALEARPWRLWLRVGCFAESCYHSRLRSVRLEPVLSGSRILLSVLLFAGAFTKVFDGRLSSVRILAQKVRAGWVLIKRFPFYGTIPDTGSGKITGDLSLREFRWWILSCSGFGSDPWAEVDESPRRSCVTRCCVQYPSLLFF